MVYSGVINKISVKSTNAPLFIYIHVYIYIYIHIYVYMCVCVLRYTKFRFCPKIPNT